MKLKDYWIYTIAIIGLLLTFTFGCEKDDPLPGFPACVGITESLDFYNIVNPYNGKIWGEDTVIITQFIFTDYDRFDYLYFLPLPGKGSWTMWIKFTSNRNIRYQKSYCYYPYQGNNYFANTSFIFNEQTTIWNFYFETFNCSELSGSCHVIRPAIPDTLFYRFKGSRYR